MKNLDEIPSSTNVYNYNLSKQPVRDFKNN